MLLIEKPEQIENNTVVALGSFDGMHRAHKGIVGISKLIASEKGLSVLVYTFRNIPASFFGAEEEYLFSEKEKIGFFEDMGIQYLFMNTFDEKIASIDPEDFLLYLKNELKAKVIVCGYNFRFGHNRKGNAEYIKDFAARNGLETYILEKETYGKTVISSTNIRKLIKEGKMERASDLLGHDYFFEGDVINGHQIGRTLGYPTINISYDKNKLLPPFGVYASTVLIDDELHIGITNIGERPTFSGDSKVTIETYLLDFDQEVYGKQVRLSLCKFIRPERKFETVEALQEEIEKNISEVRDFFEI